MNTKFQIIFFTTVLVLTLVVSVLIFWPFLIALAISGMVAVILYPVYVRLLNLLKSPSVTAGTMVLLLVVLIGLPVVFLGNQIFSEAQGMYTKLTTGGTVSVDTITNTAEHYIQRYVPDFKLNIREYLTGFSSFVVDKLGGIFSGTLDLVVKALLSLIALFYFLRDGAYFKEKLLVLSPLADDKDKLLIDSVKSAINSVLFGSLVVALAQGLLTGIGFIIFGVPNFALWGSIAAVAALVPGVGTALVWIPAVIYLYFYGGAGMWIGQLVWSVLLVGLIDNFLSPFIINKGVNVHPLLILFSILGGLQFFGPEGFLIGPLVLSVLFALLRIAQIKQV
ncbi:MAG: AI-2E family transporter [Candidatus Taylorbacteria bacterium]|nr:AI-2E family transporter [Candidatus Taylorbacteria bacterium]